MKKSERTQQRILHEASKLFNRKGYAGTHIRDIMDATGLAKGGIYGNFENKEQIELAAFDHALGVITAALAGAMEGHKGGRARLHAMLGFYERYVLEPPVEGGCPILNTAVEADDTSPALRQRVIGALDRWQARIAAIVRQGIAAGEIRKDLDADEFALMMIATIEGGIMLARAYGDVGRLRVAFAPLRRYIDTELDPR